MPAFTQCHLPMSCNQAPILPLAPELHPSSLRALIPVVARPRRSGIKFRRLPQLRGAARDVHGSVPSMHLDGMKQEGVGKSNLLATVVAVCPESKAWKLHFTLMVFSLKKKKKKSRKKISHFLFFNCNYSSGANLSHDCNKT